MQYYYPLCTKDFAFENIFASESISPYAFYAGRGFGIDYFYKIPKFHHNDALILFDKPPKYETGINGEIIKFILAINVDAIEKDCIISIDDGIIAYQKTIYLTKNNFNILFFSEKDKTIVCLKSDTSLPTKGLKKYDDNFKYIHEADCREFNVSKISSLQLNTDGFQKEIRLDKLFNYFKGFIYGLVAGYIRSQSPEEIKIKTGLQEIMNCFAELKNRNENKINSKGRIDIYPKLEQYSYFERLMNVIKDTQQLLSEFLPESSFNEQKLIKFLYQNKRFRFNNFEDVKNYIDLARTDDEIFGTNKFDQLKKYYFEKSGDKNPLFLFGLLSQQANLYISSTKQTGDSFKNERENNIDGFKNYLYEIGKIVEQLFLEKTENKSVNLESINFSFLRNEIILDSNLMELNKTETFNFLIICNVIFQNPKLGKEETRKDQILAIVEIVSNHFSKRKNGRDAKLYRYLNNEIDSYSLDKVSSVVMKNFVAFVFNTDSLEKLEKFIEAKEIEQSWMAYSFWCSFNGFANISRNFVGPIFNTCNSILQEYLDNYLQSILLKGDKNISSIIKNEPNLIPQKETSKSKEFYDIQISGKYKIPLDDFERILGNKDKEEVIKQLKEKFKIAKKNGKIIFDLYNNFVNSAVLF